MIGPEIKKWRRSSGMKQASLAHMLGVSQTAVARWENGLDNPSPVHFARLREIIAQDVSSTVRIEMRKQELQIGLNLMFELDGMKQVASSRLFQQLLPRVHQLQDQYTADYLIGKTAELYSNTELMGSIRKNEVAIITGVTSEGHLRGYDELSFKHRWSTTFQNIHTNIYVFLRVEPSELSDECDGYNILYLDDLR